MNNVFAQFKALNAPTESGGGGGSVPFDNLMSHFVVCTDEACLMANDAGQVKVFGDKSKQKHEKITNDSRVSITIVRSAATGGATGPTNCCRRCSLDGHCH